MDVVEVPMQYILTKYICYCPRPQSGVSWDLLRLALDDDSCAYLGGSSGREGGSGVGKTRMPPFMRALSDYIRER